MKTPTKGNIVLQEHVSKYARRAKALEATLEQEPFTVSTKDGGIRIVMTATPQIRSIEIDDRPNLEETLIKLLNRGLLKANSSRIEKGNAILKEK